MPERMKYLGAVGDPMCADVCSASLHPNRP
jgi:hypothetical protein